MRFCDFKGNYKALHELKEFIASNKDSLLVIGHVGTGKTALFDIIKNEYGYEMLFVTEASIQPSMITNFVKHITIENMFYKKRKLIFIDDINIVLQSDKNVLSHIKQHKTKCRFIFTVRTSEEKKVATSLKQLIDVKIILNPLNYKECFHVIMNRINESERSTIDESKLICLIKSLKCNISKVMMLIDTVKPNQDSIQVFKEDEDFFENNVYKTMTQFFSHKLTTKEIMDICLRDTHLFASLVHEHLSKINAQTTPKENIQRVVLMFRTLTFCDNFDKHIYTKCDKNVVRDMVNVYRFQSINSLLSRFYAEHDPFTFAFTQQFTKLSSQMNIKKKISKIEDDVQNINFRDSMFDILQFEAKRSHDIKEKTSNKYICDLVTKFKKEFKI